MNASNLLHDLSRRGIKLEADGRNLIVDGPADALPDHLIELLRSIKGELLAILGGVPVDQANEAAEWQEYFEERSAIREYDGGLPRDEAERLALQDAIEHWLCLNPVPASDPRSGCIYCNTGEQASNRLVPVLTADGHVWIHDRCWEAWRANRRKQAAGALHKLGLPPPHSPPVNNTAAGI